MVDLATGEAAETDPDAGKDPAAVSLGRRGGLRGGKARAEKLGKERRSKIARQAVKSRWQKKMKNRGFITVIFFLAVTMDGATAQQDQADTMGAGLKTCAEFAQDYRKAPEVAETIYFVWAQGAMSAMNLMQLALKKPRHNLAGLPTSEQQRRLRAFCDQRPLLEFAFAVRTLFEALPELPP